MQHAQKLTRLLRELLALIEEEANRNAEFADRLEAITSAIPRANSTTKSQKSKLRTSDEDQPDVMAVLQAKGEEEYRYWLRDMDIAALKKIIKVNGFDPGKRSIRWTEPDKLIAMIVEQASARLRRGAAFLPPKSSINETSE